MKSDAATPEEYIDQLPEDRKEAFSRLRKTILDNLPQGFEEKMSYGMVGYVVPHSIYPSGYHCNPALPLPFISISSQKNSVSLHHMGIYSDKGLFEWFRKEFEKDGRTKPDIGKSCIRFKNPEKIPLVLIGNLCQKMSPEDWIAVYEEQFKRRAL